MEYQSTFRVINLLDVINPKINHFLRYFSANEAEVEELKVIWKSEECLQAVMTFFSSKL